MTMAYHYDSSQPFGTEADIIIGIDEATGIVISLPMDERNVNYVELMREVEAGNVVIAPFEARRPPP